MLQIVALVCLTLIILAILRNRGRFWIPIKKRKRAFHNVLFRALQKESLG